MTHQNQTKILNHNHNPNPIVEIPLDTLKMLFKLAYFDGMKDAMQKAVDGQFNKTEPSADFNHHFDNQYYRLIKNTSVIS